MMSLLPLLPRPSSLLAAKAWSSPPSSSSSFVTCSVMAAKRWRKKNQPAFQSELRNPVAAVYGGSEMTAEKGHIYDHKPFRVRVEKYQVYDWCGCGLSHMQPFCDGTHTNRSGDISLSPPPPKKNPTTTCCCCCCCCPDTSSV